MADKLTEKVTVEASPQRCFDVATDFDAYPEWSTDIKKVDVIERDDQDRPVLVRFWAEALGRSSVFALKYDYSHSPRQLKWSLVEGDIERSLDGEYLFDTVAGQTELTYNLEVDLRVPMPGFVRRRAEGRIVGAALHELKTRAES